MSKIQVIEKQIPFYYNVKSFEIIITGLQLNQLVILIARCYDIDNKFLFDKIYTIEGEEYLLWGNDDEYLINLVALKLGVVLEPVLEVV